MRYIRDLEENDGIHCKTEEEAKAILELANKEVLTWAGGEPFLRNLRWGVYSTDTVYFIKEGLYGSIKGDGNDNRKIYPASDFLEESTGMVEFILRRSKHDKREWSTDTINGFQIRVYYFENKDMFEADLIDKKLGCVVHSIKNASSLEDICLQFEHNINPLNLTDWEDGFCVDYERSNPAKIAQSISTKLEECAATFKKIADDLDYSITLPKVHVPKKFKSFSI